MTARRLRRLQATLDRRQPDLQVMLDQVNKAHNLAAILRTCDAVGAARAHAVSPRGPVRSHGGTSAGATRWVPVTTHATAEEGLRALRETGLRIYAAHLSDTAVDYRSVDYTRPCAVVLGAELWGVSETARGAADAHIAIPMMGLTESLNVSVAAAVILFEAQRQRLAAGMYEAPRLDPETYRRTLFEWMQPAVAKRCRQEGRPYPALDAEGHVVRDPSD